MSAHLVYGTGDDGLIFTNEKGLPLNRHRIADIFKRAAMEVGVDATFHAMRYFYASVLIRSGASVKVVQEPLAPIVHEMTGSGRTPIRRRHPVALPPIP